MEVVAPFASAPLWIGAQAPCWPIFCRPGGAPAPLHLIRDEAKPAGWEAVSCWRSVRARVFVEASAAQEDAAGFHAGLVLTVGQCYSPRNCRPRHADAILVTLAAAVGELACGAKRHTHAG